MDLLDEPQTVDNEMIPGRKWLLLAFFVLCDVQVDFKSYKSFSPTMFCFKWGQSWILASEKYIYPRKDFF